MAEVMNEGAENAKAEKAGKTVKYRCTEKCYWTAVLYREGDTVDVPEGVKVPAHFTKVN